MMKLYFFLPILIFFSTIKAEGFIPKSPGVNPVFVCTNQSRYAKSMLDALEQCSIKFELVDGVSANDDANLYIIFDAYKLDPQNLPKYFIVYQTLDLTAHKLSQSYKDILQKSVAVWDYSQQNINKYRSGIYNYYYFPARYEFTDPVILPCCIPVSRLEAYKALLIDSNQRNTDISSHLPVLFCHTVIRNPHIFVEAGVRGGESTKPIAAALNSYDAQLIGIDIDPYWEKSYNSLKNAVFVLMNDVYFDAYFRNHYSGKNADFIFIDTSHTYEHTLQEIKVFAPLLSDTGTLAFHDSNVTPLAQDAYSRLNGTSDRAPGNPRGVTQALKEYFALEFNEYAYYNDTFTRNGITWHIIHYPYCNGFTLIQKLHNN